MKKQEKYLSKEQFRIQCHIGKRTALWLIQSGLVPALDTGRKTDRYILTRSAVDQYLKDRERDPQKYRYVRAANTTSLNRVKMPSQRKIAQMLQALRELWSEIPDLLSIQDVSLLIGYSQNQIRVWRKEALLDGIMLSRRLFIPKAQLINFILSPTLLNLSPKSVKHIEIMREIHYEGM